MVLVPEAMIGCIEYDGSKPSAERPGPANACSSCSRISLEPLAAHTFALDSVDPGGPGQVVGQLLPQRHRVPVRVPVQLHRRRGHRRGQVGDQRSRWRVGVLVGVDLHRHVQLRRAVGRLADQVRAQRQVGQGHVDADHVELRRVEPRGDRLAVRGQVLGGRQRQHMRRHLGQRARRVVDHLHLPQERHRGQARRRTGPTRRWAARGWTRRSSRPATPASRTRRTPRRRCGSGRQPRRRRGSGSPGARRRRRRRPRSRRRARRPARRRTACRSTPAAPARCAWSATPVAPAAASTASASSTEVVISTDAASGSCSACEIRSAAT